MDRDELGVALSKATDALADLCIVLEETDYKYDDFDAQRRSDKIVFEQTMARFERALEANRQ